MICFQFRVRVSWSFICTVDVWFSCRLWCAWECALPLGCQSGRSVWKCCSLCKSTEKETQRSKLELPLAQTRTAWNQLTDISCDRPVRCVQAQKPDMKTTEMSLDSSSYVLWLIICTSRYIWVWRCKTIKKIKHSCLNCRFHTYFFIFLFALSL